MNGPVMLVATTVLRKQETRIGQVAGNFTLPRTVRLKTLLFAGAGLVPGTLAGSIIGNGITPVMYGGFFGAAIAVFLVTFEPMPGESVFTYLRLNVTSKRRTNYVRGRAVSLAVGVSPLPSVVTGPVLLYPGAVNVQPDMYDDRGVLKADTRSVMGLAADPTTWTHTSTSAEYTPRPVSAATGEFAPQWGPAQPPSVPASGLPQGPAQ